MFFICSSLCLVFTFIVLSVSNTDSLGVSQGAGSGTAFKVLNNFFSCINK